tara:strand:- start:269 stop:538 length:270 start_codon:yes stop_codon:yes gene_type:complete
MTVVKRIRGEHEAEHLKNYLAQYRVTDSLLSETVFSGIRIFHYRRCTVVMVEKDSEKNHYLYVSNDDGKFQGEVLNELEQIALSNKTSE